MSVLLVKWHRFLSNFSTSNGRTDRPRYGDIMCCNSC